LTDPLLPPEIADLSIDADAPLLVVDVEEVLAMFMRGFERFVALHGYEMRITRFALFQNIYRCEDGAVMELARGRELFDSFFATDVEHIDPAPGAQAALADLAGLATIVILTNAPPQGRDPRARWLEKNGFPYPLVINTGPKGPAVAAMARRTRGPIAFIDDLLPNLDSVAEHAPAVRRFQLVADERLRPFAPVAPERHLRIDDWPTMGPALAAALTAQP
jgi:hypothetical protein